MKKLWIALVALALACGNESYEDEQQGSSYVDGGAEPAAAAFQAIGIEVDDGEATEGDFGTLEQKLTIPNGYGLSGGMVGRCWSGVSCIHPGSKTYPRKFAASTCSAYHQGRFVAADIRFAEQTPWFSVTTPGSIASAKNVWRCASGNGTAEGCAGALGCAIYTYSSASRIMSHVDIYLFPDNFETLTNWSSKTQAQKDRIFDNAILHEIYHSVAAGHSDATLDSPLMKPYPDSAWYASLLGLTLTERSWLRDYQP